MKLIFISAILLGCAFAKNHDEGDDGGGNSPAPYPAPAPSPQPAPNLSMDCMRITPGGGVLRCENAEVVCYVSQGISCKWKSDQ